MIEAVLHNNHKKNNNDNDKSIEICINQIDFSVILQFVKIK